jgi:SAM-dependent methyltransferase
MSSYVERHAALYDVFYADKPYAREAAFVSERLLEAGVQRNGRILELACGTGRHAFELEKLGYRVLGTDYSPDMLACAAAAQQRARSGVEFREMDMRSLDIEGPPFDAIVSLFDSIGYVQTNEALLQVLTGAHRHLRPDGVMLIEFWHAAAMLRAYDPVRVRRFRVPEGEIIRISETSLDVARQVASVKYTIVEPNADGLTRRLEETQTNRYFLVQEMAGWLDRAGFETVRCYSGFDVARPIDGDTWHVIAVARRRG